MFSTGEIAETEAQMRWETPMHGLLLPSGFIQVAEETDLIVPIWEWEQVLATRS
jgi:EAL domain-containing protein (putative c-di-GMP-specific phosphodiesterase class I)